MKKKIILTSIIAGITTILMIDNNSDFEFQYEMNNGYIYTKNNEMIFVNKELIDYSKSKNIKVEFGGLGEIKDIKY